MIVRIDGRVASVRELAEGVGASIDLCGQHEHQRLMRRETHVELLDAWAQGEVSSARAAYAEAFVEARRAEAELRQRREMSEAADSQVDEAAFVLSRIDEVAPQEGEYEELEDALPTAEHAETLLRTASGVHEALSGDDGVIDTISGLVRELREAADLDRRLEKRADALESSLIDIEDTASELRRYQDGIDLDEGSLARMQERMSQLQGLLHSYGPRMQEVFERRQRAAELNCILLLPQWFCPVLSTSL